MPYLIFNIFNSTFSFCFCGLKSLYFCVVASWVVSRNSPIVAALKNSHAVHAGTFISSACLTGVFFSLEANVEMSGNEESDGKEGQHRTNIHNSSIASTWWFHKPQDLWWLTRNVIAHCHGRLNKLPKKNIHIHIRIYPAMNCQINKFLTMCYFTELKNSVTWTSRSRRSVVPLMFKTGTYWSSCTITGWCSTPTLLLIWSSFSRENGHPLLICSSLSTVQIIIIK